MDTLLWLLLVVALGALLLRFAAARAGRAAHRDDGNAAGAWHSVSVVSGSGACTSVRELASRRWLPGQAPKLPLADCDQSQCRCRYRRHEDRRDDEDRRNPLGTLDRFGGFETNTIEERRQDSDRRHQPG